MGCGKVGRGSIQAAVLAPVQPNAQLRAIGPCLGKACYLPSHHAHHVMSSLPRPFGKVGGRITSRVYKVRRKLGHNGTTKCTQTKMSLGRLA